MKNKMSLLRGLLLALSLVSATIPVHAEIKPIPMPADAKLVEFPYEPNDTFVVLARPKSITDIVLHPDEEVIGLALGTLSSGRLKMPRGISL